MSFFGIILIVAAFILCLKGIIIVQQAEVVIIERLGKFHRVLNSGFNFIIPILDSPRAMDWKVTQKGFDEATYSVIQKRTRIDLREAVYDFPRQDVITKDNVNINIDAVLYFQIVDPKSAVYEVQNLLESIENLTQTNLRNLVGKLDLDETVSSRDKINQELRIVLDEATNKWGVKVNRVELREVEPPINVKNEMEKLLKADREKKAAIAEAEGLKQSAILKAEGEKQAEIQRAEGEKQANILRAEGVAQARILEADGEKEAIGRIINALADKGKPDQYLIAMKYLETMQEITSGKDNKVVYMPYEATGILSSVDGIKEMFKGTCK